MMLNRFDEMLYIGDKVKPGCKYIFPAFKNRFEELNLLREIFIHISFIMKRPIYEPTVGLI